MTPELEIGAKKFTRTCQDDEGDTEYNRRRDGKIEFFQQGKRSLIAVFNPTKSCQHSTGGPPKVPSYLYSSTMLLASPSLVLIRVHSMQSWILNNYSDFVQHFQRNTKFQTYLRSIQLQVRSSMAWNPVSQSQLKADHPPLTPEALIELLGAGWRFLPSPQQPRRRSSLLWASAKQHHYQNITGDVCID